MSERIATILGRLQGLEPVDPGALHEVDLKSLLDHALHGEKLAYRAQAMQVLVKARGKASAEMLRQLLHDPKGDPAIRASAAMHLARIGNPDAERTLVDALGHSADLAVAIRIAHALALIGGRPSIDPLRGLSTHDDPLVRQQASFSLAVVACRAGASGHEPEVPAEDRLLRPEAEEAWPLAVEPIAASDSDALLTSSVDTYGEKVSSDNAYRLRCGDNEMALLFNAQLSGADPSIAAARHPQIAGFLLDRSTWSESYSTGGLLLTWPHTASSAHLALFRPSGQLLMFGQTTIERGSAAFEIAGVRGPGGLPALVRGRVEGRRVRIDEAVSVRTRAALASRQRRKPEETHPPS
jgi:HEAT repeats